MWQRGCTGLDDDGLTDLVFEISASNAFERVDPPAGGADRGLGSAAGGVIRDLLERQA